MSRYPVDEMRMRAALAHVVAQGGVPSWLQVLADRQRSGGRHLTEAARENIKAWMRKQEMRHTGTWPTSLDANPDKTAEDQRKQAEDAQIQALVDFAEQQPK